jgi:NAD(P)H-dependent FMN reductase
MSQSKGIIILGSARSEGNTRTVVEYLQEKSGFDLLDLKTKNIGHFDYEFKNRQDDFIPLMQELVERYDTIVFATPVYWYSMSGHMKVFFDRLTDCLKTDKETGRKLRGKNMAMLSCSNADDLNEGFEIPFQLTARYLGMNYLGEVHSWADNGQMPAEVKNRVEEFAAMLKLALTAAPAPSVESKS